MDRIPRKIIYPNAKWEYVPRQYIYIYIYMGIEGNNYEKPPPIVHHSTLVHMNGATGRPRRWSLIGTNRPHLGVEGPQGSRDEDMLVEH